MELILRNINKVYTNKKKGQDVHAVTDFNLQSDKKEFIVFVGPSGCGKSTTLRMIAGLEEITSGELLMDGELMNKVEPSDRNIAMVFQSYALYPHMTAYENMAFGLKNRHVPKEEINQRVNAAAKILGIENLLKRKPKAMSGGQRQRVALGRAIVRRPKLFLLDEPLSNLDAKLRAQMRVEISRLYNALDTTFIYVTHDQVEAMTMGDRIVVMRDGIIQQADTPVKLFDYPANRFVAGFLGTPQMNFFEVTIQKISEQLSLFFPDGDSLTVPLKDLRKVKEEYLDGQGHKAILGIRPEHLGIADNGLSFKVTLGETLGSETQIYGTISSFQSIIKIPNRVVVKPDEEIKVSFPYEKMHLFDGETEKSILADDTGMFLEAPALIKAEELPAVEKPKRLDKIKKAFHKKKS